MALKSTQHIVFTMALSNSRVSASFIAQAGVLIIPQSEFAAESFPSLGLIASWQISMSLSKWNGEVQNMLPSQQRHAHKN